MYLSNISLKPSDKLNGVISELILTPLQIYYDFDLQKIY